MFKKLLLLSIVTVALTIQCTKKESTTAQDEATVEASQDATANAAEATATDANAADTTTEAPATQNN